MKIHTIHHFSKDTFQIKSIFNIFATNTNFNIIINILNITEISNSTEKKTTYFTLKAQIIYLK